MKTELDSNPKILDTKREFNLIIDYRKSLEEMIVAGRYKHWDSNINITNFPVIKPFEVVDDVVSVKAKILELSGSEFFFEKEIQRIYKNGYRPANLAELLALGATHPHFQYQERISCIGSIWYKKDKLINLLVDPLRLEGDSIITCLEISDLERVLSTHELNQNFLRGYEYRHFLAVIE